MRHPLEAIPPQKRPRVFLPLLVATLALTILFRFIGPSQPYTIIDFELAGSVIQAHNIVGGWTELGRIQAGFSLGIDYLYMPLYSTTIALACVWAAGVLARRSSWAGSIGIGLAWGLWLAALFDAIENIALLVILYGSIVDPWPAIAQMCATLKFGLIILGLVYTLAGVLDRLLGQRTPQAAG